MANYKHIENEYIDFKNEPLLEHRFSDKGLVKTKGDVNGDGLEDVLIGVAAGFGFYIIIIYKKSFG